MENRIGDEQVLEIRGMPDFPKLRLEPESRPGTDGNAIWEQGTWGEPFTVQTSVDAADRAAAWDAYLRYVRMIEGDPVEIVQNGVNLAGEDWQYQVLAVRPIEIAALALAQGGLNPPSAGWCVVEWTILPVLIDDA